MAAIFDRSHSMERGSPAVLVSEEMATSLMGYVRQGNASENREVAVNRILACFQTVSPSLDLCGLGLTQIPPEIGRLDFLIGLNLGNNNLRTLPQELSALKNLEVLTLISNDFHHIPEVVGDLKALVDLNLMDNVMEQVTHLIAQLSQLKILDLSHNPLSVLPNELCQLTSLETLDLSNTAIETIPAQTDRLTTLKRLTLEQSPLICEIPQCIFNLPAECRVSFAYTHLTQEAITKARLIMQRGDYQGPKIDLRVSAHASRPAAPNVVERRFVHVGGEDLEALGVLTSIFNRILTPLYGSQEKALGQIAEGSDRTCFLLYEGDNPTGVLVFKTVLSDEFEAYGITRSIEVKSLFVDNALQNSGRGLGSALINKLKKEVKKLDLGNVGIHVTVSEKKEDSLKFFKKKGFNIKHAWTGRYNEGVKEYLLHCPNIIQKQGDPVTYQTQRSYSKETSERPTSPDSRFTAQLVGSVQNAHAGRIHGLQKLSDNSFISGSEDNSISKWNTFCKRIRVVDEVEPNCQNEKDWITAIAIINSHYWVSGKRNGQITLWDTAGNFVKDIQAKLPRRGHVSHRHNQKRVNCLASGLDPQAPTVFIGFPTQFDEYNLIEGRTASITITHSNDWVYSILPITDKQLLVVTGCTVSHWHKSDYQKWNHTNTIIAEPKRVRRKGLKKKQRPFISSLISLQPSNTLFATAGFDGKVNMFDLETNQIIRTWNGSTKRVWQAESISETLFATGCEEGIIKFWDVREQNCVRMIECEAAIHSLLSIDELLIAGIGPEGPSGALSGGQLNFYDLRQ